LVFAGELKDWKGARLALDAALRFFEVEPEAELTIIGDGPLRMEMEAAVRAHPAANRVAFVGQVSVETLLGELNEGDVFIYPSFHHGLATVVLQAMLTGLPIVCIEGDAIARTVGQEAGISVTLHHERDPVEDIADALRELSADEPRRRALACAARNMAREKYSYDKLAGELVATYRQMVGARKES
jgi:glycosyltransferase involved in cell wall biosynthesis